MRKAVSDYDGQSVRIASYASAHKIEPREVAGVKVCPVRHTPEHDTRPAA